MLCFTSLQVIVVDEIASKKVSSTNKHNSGT
jgi:hypothetical protein